MGKNTLRVIGLVFMAGPLLTVTVSAQSEVSPRKQFKQLLEQFQSAPGNADLRSQIITLSRTVKPLPAIPDAAIESEGRGKFIFKNAKSTQDYLEAAKEYEKATNAAPWVLGYYSDLCTIEEKAVKYVEAKGACEFYLLGLTDQEEIADTKGRIAGLKLGIEKENSPAEQFRKKIFLAQDEFTSLIRKIDGADFTRDDGAGNYMSIDELHFHKDADNKYLECLLRYKVVRSDNPEDLVTGQWVNLNDSYLLPKNESEFDGCLLFNGGHYKVSIDGKIIYDINKGNRWEFHRQ